MRHYRRRLSLPLATLSAIFASVFLLGSSASAQTLIEVRPLSQNEQIIAQQAEDLAQKADRLNTTSLELKQLESKKSGLAQKLETEKNIIKELKQRISDKNARQAEAARLAWKQRPTQRIAQFAQSARIYFNNSAGNTYGYGYCTWYIKNQRPDLPNSLGNANSWFYRARAMGLATGTTPRVGAVGTTEAGSLGHVVIVRSVNSDGTITISEMNYAGWNTVSSRTTPANQFRYIY